MQARSFAPDFSELLKKRTIEMSLKKEVPPEQTQEIPLTQQSQDSEMVDMTTSAPPPLPSRPSSREAGELKHHAIERDKHENKTPPSTPSTVKVTTANIAPTPAAPETTFTAHQQESKDNVDSKTNHDSACTR